VGIRCRLRLSADEVTDELASDLGDSGESAVGWLDTWKGSFSMLSRNNKNDSRVLEHLKE
jgi:hypothetical protein